MAKSQTSKRDDEYELGRRALIKWTVAAGAALGVSRSKVFDILSDTGGPHVAHALTAVTRTRSIHFACGNGGLAWCQLLWPHPEVAQANNPNFAWHKPGQGMLYPGTQNPLFIGPDTPWASLPAARQVTAFVAGANNTHNSNAQEGSLLNGNGIYAVASVLQAETPTVIPIISVGNVSVGSAPGFTQATGVGDGNGIVGLFNSAASRAGGLLSKMTDASLYKTQYDAFAQLNKAAGRSTQRGSYTTASNAAQFLGTNLASKLAIQSADQMMYGIDGNMRGNVRQIAEALIVSVKAFGMGLTNSVVIPFMLDDPHGAFNGDVNIVPAQLKKVLDGFMTHLTATVDSVTMKSLADDCVVTFHGDTTKDPLTASGWPDGTNNNSAAIWMLGSGHVETGWLGKYGADGTVKGVDAQKNLVNYSPTDTAKLANATVAYAIAKRDIRAINQFTGNVQAKWFLPLDQ